MIDFVSLELNSILKATYLDLCKCYIQLPMPNECYTPSREERRFLYFNHLSKEFLEQMIPHLKALI